MALRWQKRLPENQNITINLGVLRALLAHQKGGLISFPFSGNPEWSYEIAISCLKFCMQPIVAAVTNGMMTEACGAFEKLHRKGNATFLIL
jgi:hypothetical protein